MKTQTLGRRDFMKAMGLGAAALTAPRIFAAEKKTDLGKPNIIYILADDMGFGDLACQNPDSKIPTPNLDRIASQGMRFTDAHSGSAVCTPTRYGVLTGRYCWRTRLIRGVLGGFSPPLIAPKRMTVASLMKQSGYATCCIGKWHLGLEWPAKSRPDDPREIDYTKPIERGPTTLGFDNFFGISASLDMPPYVYIRNDRAVVVPTARAKGFGRPGPKAPGLSPEDVLPALTKEAVAWIEKKAELRLRKPVFMYFPLTAPHTPIAPNKQFLGKSKAGRYGDFVVEVDWCVGQVMRALEKAGLADNTLLIFTSDNGPERMAQGRIRQHKHRSMGQYRGMKRDIWDGGHRIPFLARWPGKIRPGSTSDRTTCLTDLIATCADILGKKLPKDAGEDSYSILPALLGADAGKPIREATVHHSSKGMFAIRQGRWKLVLGPGSGGNRYPSGPNALKKGDPSGQLYDMTADESEKKNLYNEHPEIVERLTALLEKYKRQGHSRPM